MSGVNLAIRVEDQASAELRQMILAAGDLRPMLSEIGAQLVANRQLRFEGGYGPNRVPWKPSGRALAARGKTLVDRGRLQDSVVRQTPAVTDRTVTISTNLEYAAVHEQGATIRAKTVKGLRFKGPRGWARVQQVVIPARPFMAADRQDLTDIQEIATDHMLPWKRGTGGGA